MSKLKATFVDVIPDPELKRKQAAVTKAVEKILPGCGPVILYRTAEGKIGFQMNVRLTAGDRRKLDQAYRAVMKVVGLRRGRPMGQKTVQTKLLLPEPVYLALKREAERSNVTMSSLAADALKARLAHRV
jgi:hypothetical protein